ncbi:MAG TPA: histidine kinase dimerization/phospho-acceptor domain-containing protein, partial [Kineosporiaceae bacterium]|nr:histidine kinase dimerization/phospho-acceptor domain-containing protein [Kineosporiaceae bacterium]
MPEPLRVLLVEDRQDDAELIGLELRRAGFTVDCTRVDTDRALAAALAADPADGPDLVLCDYSLPGMDPNDVLRRCCLARPDVPVIVASGVMDEQTCVQALRHGAVDFLLKDRLARLGPAVKAALNAAELARAARQATARERVTADLMAALVNRAPAAICVRDRDGRTLVANDRYREMVERGMVERGMVEQGMVEQGMVERDLVEPLPSEQMSVPELGVLSRNEIQLGDSTYLALQFPIPDSGGGRLAEGSILTDITAQKRTEQQLRSARGELQQQAGELRASNEELRELDQLKNDFVSSVSHELRTPLTSIVGYSELLVDAGIGAPGSAHRRMVEMISGNAQRLLALIDTLLTLSRMDGLTAGTDEGQAGRAASAGAEDSADGATPAATVVVSELVKSACEVMMPSLDAAGLTLRTMLAEPLPPLAGDRNQLERTLLN